jgi:hypothetical protein
MFGRSKGAWEKQTNCGPAAGRENKHKKKSEERVRQALNETSGEKKSN